MVIAAPRSSMASHKSSSSLMRTVMASWRSSTHGDPEKSTPSSPRKPRVVTSITSPASAHVREPTPTSPERAPWHGPLDDFFGCTPPVRLSQYCEAQLPVLAHTRESTSGGQINFSSIDLDVEAPPPYNASGDLPAYSKAGEPKTLAKTLFQFGFIFPLFWLFGAFIILVRLREPAEWANTKGPVERLTMLRSIRNTERIWAKRCLAAWCILCIALLAAGLALIVVTQSAI